MKQDGMMMSRFERRVAWCSAAIVVALGLLVMARTPSPQSADAPAKVAALPCGLDKRLTAEQCRRVVDYLVGLGLQSGSIPAITAEELRQATGMEMPEESLPCLQEYARGRLAERRNPSARLMLPSRTPSLV
jgi:hypothetical protein